MTTELRSAPRARPAARLRRPARPDEILAAACRAIVERGYADTRVGDIAAAAGTSTGTIHYYYSSKQEVLEAALRWATESLFAQVEATAGSGALDRLARLLEVSIPYPDRDEWVLWVEMWTLVLRAPERMEALEDLSLRWRGFFFDVVAEGVAGCEFAPVAPIDVVAERLIALVDGLGFETVVGYRWSSSARMRSLLVAFAAEQLGVEPTLLEASMATQ